MSQYSDDCCMAATGRLCERHARGVLPQLAEPWWYREVKTGDANLSTENPDNVRSRQKHEREQAAERVRRRRERMGRLMHATTGAFTGRNRAA